MTNQQFPLPENQMGPAEQMLDLVLNSSAHLWHNRPGLDVNGKWYPQHGAGDLRGQPVQPGLFVPAAVTLYGKLLDIFKLNPELMAHFASYALSKTEWRDLKVACCALMLVQNRYGEPVFEDDGSVAFYDDDYRNIGEAMLLQYEKNSTSMLTPKGVLRVAELLEVRDIARLNREAGFGDPAGRKPLLGRWHSAAKKWLVMRERNQPMLEGLVSAGYKETIKKIARKAGYKPLSENFFAILGWKQKQCKDGHRSVGLGDLKLRKRGRFDGLSEAEICETIVTQKLKYKDVVGRLPADIGLTAAIMVAVLPSLSNRDLRQLTPTLEELGLLQEPEIRDRWEEAVSEATDQRALNIARNVSNKAIKEKLEEAADNAARKAVQEATRDVDVEVMFLIDKSGSMEGAIEQSKQALSRILAGFPMDKVHIATFDTVGWILKPKAASRKAVQHMLNPVNAGGGTMYSAGVNAIYRSGVRFASEARLIVIAVGDEWGEAGREFARSFRHCGYNVDAMALMVNVSWTRGSTVRDCARELMVPYSEVTIEQFDDPYQVPRVLQALLDAPRQAGARSFGLVERVMSTPLLSVAF